MSSQHTPGPWRLDDPIHGDVISDDYHMIDGGSGFLSERRPGFGVTGHMTIHDARLMAAAPELLEALQALLDATFEDGDDNVRDISDCLDDRLIGHARAAIAKATEAPRA